MGRVVPKIRTWKSRKQPWCTPRSNDTLNHLQSSLPVLSLNLAWFLPRWGCTDTCNNTTLSLNGSVSESPNPRPTLWMKSIPKSKTKQLQEQDNNIRLLARHTKLVTHRAYTAPQRRSLIHSQNVNKLTRPATWHNARSNRSTLQKLADIQHGRQTHRTLD